MMNSKDLLAKLLATEDVTVLHANAKTASFDVKNRVLTLPIWKDMTNETYDHLTGHEVGHALYTPADGWGDELDKGRGAGFKSFLNVVEDARIEKLIQRRYPGLRRSFIMSYKKMLADGLFGADIDKINTLPLIDRLNTLFKVGLTAGVRIDPEEKVWVEEIEKLETWDEVVDVATRLYEYAKAKKEEEDALAQEMMHEFEDGDDDGESDGEEKVDNGESFDSELNESIDGENGLNSEDEPEDESEDDSVGSGYKSDDVESQTDKSLTQNINAEYNDNSGVEVKNIMLNDNDVSPLIVDYKTIISDFEKYDQKMKSIGEEHDWMGNGNLMMSRGEKLFTKFLSNNKKAIAYMVKEFEMKKSADEYVRATVSKTGVIDPVKMNSYRYNDDIFKKVTTVPEGKSHGMIMYLDWSGSMYLDLKATIDQLLNLVNFCRNVNIPFRVYAFTDMFRREGLDDFSALISDGCDVDSLFYPKGFRFLEFFNSKMNKKDFVAMSKYMLSLGDSHRKCPTEYNLSGTPLDTTIMGAIKLHELFLKNHRVDIVNTIFLTDGESHPSNVKTTALRPESDDFNSGLETYEYTTGLNSLRGWRFDGQVNLIDPVTKKRYIVVPSPDSQEYTEMFLKIYRERTGSNVIGFRILPTTKGKIQRELYYLGYEIDFAEMTKKMKKEKYVVIPTTGYTKYFGIAGGEELATANGHFEVADDVTTAQLRNAFKKASKNKVTSRALLNEFIREVA